MKQIQEGGSCEQIGAGWQVSAKGGRLWRSRTMRSRRDRAERMCGGRDEL